MRIKIALHHTSIPLLVDTAIHDHLKNICVSLYCLVRTAAEQFSAQCTEMDEILKHVTAHPRVQIRKTTLGSLNVVSRNIAPGKTIFLETASSGPDVFTLILFRPDEH